MKGHTIETLPTRPLSLSHCRSIPGPLCQHYGYSVTHVACDECSSVSLRGQLTSYSYKGFSCVPGQATTLCDFSLATLLSTQSGYPVNIRNFPHCKEFPSPPLSRSPQDCIGSSVHCEFALLAKPSVKKWVPLPLTHKFPQRATSCSHSCEYQHNSSG